MANITNIVRVEDIQIHAPGVDVTLDDKTMAPFVKPAHKAVATILGAGVFNGIATLTDDVLLDYLKSAVANRLMYDYKLFETIQKRQTSKIDVFKYELQGMQDVYLGYYYDALDSIIKELNDSPEKVSDWKNSPVLKTCESLLIRDTDEFNSFYGIDGSDYFFFATAFLQRKVIDTYLTAVQMDALADELLRRIKGAVATMTVAYALRQFDFSMLPKSLRNSSADGAARSGSAEQDSMYKLSDRLLDQGEKELSQITFEINSATAVEDIPSTSNQNRPEYKFFLL